MSDTNPSQTEDFHFRVVLLQSKVTGEYGIILDNEDGDEYYVFSQQQAADLGYNLIQAAGAMALAEQMQIQLPDHDQDPIVMGESNA